MNRFFYDLDGSPLTGKTPVQVHVYGDGDHDTALNEAEGEIAAFLDAVRLSTATQHRREATLESGGSVRMHAVDDVITVEVFTEPRKVGGEPYYGGILVKLNVVPDEAKFRRDCMEDAPPGATLIRHDIKEVIAHAKSSGASPTKPGRPAVPGTEDEDEAEWLILQIAPDKRLDDDPFNKEAIKIFRIAAPQFGPLTEYGQAAEFPVPANAEEEKYIMSAEVSRSSDSNLALTKFFMCGQQIEDIPPLGVAPFSAVTVTSAGWAQTISLRAVDFVPESFEKAYAAGGIVIVAMPHGLFALNTAEKTSTAPATWKTLSTVQASNAGFGAQFSDTTDAFGVRTITCFGTSGAGACTSYTVRIAPGLNGAPPTITGTMTPNDMPYSPGAPAVMAYTKTMTGVAGGLAVSPLPPLVTQNAERYTTGTRTMTCSSTYKAASPPYQYDWYSGELLFREEPETLSYSASANYSPVTVGNGVFSCSMTSDSNSMSWEMNRNIFVPPFYEVTASAPGVPNFEAAPQDLHRRVAGPMFLSRGRTGSWSYGSPSTPSGTELSDTVVFSGDGTWHWSEMSVDYRILAQNGTTIYHWGNIQNKFPTIDASLWEDLSLSTTIGPGSPPGVPLGGGGLPIEPPNAPRAAPEPPEYIDSYYRYHYGYPELGVNTHDSWTYPPIPYFDPLSGIITPWYSAISPLNSWSFTATYDPLDTGATMSAVEAATTFPASGYRDGTAQYAFAFAYGSGMTYLASIAKPISATMFVVIAPVQGPFTGGMWGTSNSGHPAAWMGPDPVDDRYIRDPRTGGFIAQMYWSAEITEDPIDWAFPLRGYTVPLKHPVSCEIIVGNELGTVPLAALLNEWMELGEKAGSFGSLPLSYDLVFIDDRGAQATMLI